MKQYLVVLKEKSFIIDADAYRAIYTEGGRCTTYEFYKEHRMIATFKASCVKAIVEQ